jgi:hypothetical protein
VVYDGPSRALTPALLMSIYGAEHADLFAPALEPVMHPQAQPAAVFDVRPAPAIPHAAIGRARAGDAERLRA